MKSYSVRILAVIATLSLIANVLLYFRYSPSRPLVTVGSAVITKKQFSDQLEYDAGRPVLTKLVFSALVAQAAARAGVVPTAQDVEDRVQAIARQSPQILVPYSRDPVKMAQFRDELATSMALENLRIQEVALSPKQISDYYAGHQADFVLLPQNLATMVVTQNPVDAETAADLLRRNDPPDVIARQPRLRVVGTGGYSPDLQALPLALKQQISRFAGQAQTGAVKTFRSGTFYVTLRAGRRCEAVTPPLSQVRGEVERAARLALAPSPQEELSRLYQRAKPSFNSGKYAAYFASP